MLSTSFNYELSCFNLYLFNFFQQAAQDNRNEDILSQFDNSPLYFTRTRGLFRECFPGEKTNAPTDGKISKLPFSVSAVYLFELGIVALFIYRRLEDFSISILKLSILNWNGPLACLVRGLFWNAHLKVQKGSILDFKHLKYL